MNTRLKNCLLAAALAVGLGLVPSADAGLPPGVSGAWYNPAQSGHGLSLEILAPDRALLFWYLYDAEGQPFFLYIDGRIEGRSIEGNAFAPKGMRFGSFDRSGFDMPEWGTVRIDFDDCNNGLLHWDALSSEFGSGSTELRRLSRIHASDCVLEAETPALAGLVDTWFRREQHDPAIHGGYRGIGAVDPAGRVWTAFFSRVSPDGSPTNNSVSDRSCIGLGSLEAVSEGMARARWRVLNNWWSRTVGVSEGCQLGEWHGLVETSSEGVDLPSPGQTRDERWEPEDWIWQIESRTSASLVAPLSLAQIARSYEVRLAWQFGAYSVPMVVNADGTICLTKQSDSSTSQVSCALSGRLWLSEPQAGFFDFELADAERPAADPYRGRGWMEAREDGNRLVLVGENGANGLGVVGR
jgi:hypothetical protein